jgi:catechol 2,3-dioxygenase-like lactoylglutathione lyase family enzyme
MRTLPALLDHVAVAVPDPLRAERRWRAQLGGGLVAHEDSGAFVTRQLRFAGGGKLELLAPSGGSADGFVRRFLDRFGSVVHHVTLKVPDLRAAVDTVRGAGLDVVDVDESDPWWHEGFLRPSQVGGIIVQLAWSPEGDEGWARRIGHTPEEPRTGAATLLGPTLRHPDLDRAARLWELLGARVDRADALLRCAWPDSPLDVVVEAGAPAGPRALRFAGTAPLPAEDGVGPAVEAAEA